jgi:peptidoglycan-associated lipoprotein
MKLLIKLLFIVVPVTLLLGCPATTPTNGADVTEVGGATTGGVDGDAEGGLAMSGELANRVIYFDLDSSEVKPEFRPLISAHARYLAGHASAKVTLEGHADERGSREYNLALGERRANSVRALLTAEGAQGSQLTTVSYGEEQPAAAEHDENAWQLNRRVGIVYTAK